MAEAKRFSDQFQTSAAYHDQTQALTRFAMNNPEAPLINISN
jgi:hypothetical protein